MNNFPKYLFHPEHGAKLLHSAEEEMALEGKWHESPAHFDNELIGTPKCLLCGEIICPSDIEHECKQVLVSEPVTKGKRRK